MIDTMQIPSYHVKVDSLNLHYKCLGQGQPVVLIHGSSNDWREWQMNLPILAREFRVYALDLPGFGLSESSEPLSLPGMSSFLNSFMHESGMDKAHLIGHSLGGVIALAFALDFPERVGKVVLVNSAGLGELSPAGQLLLSAIRGIKKAFGRYKETKYKESSPEEWILVNRLKEVKQPVMLIWGEWDPYLSISHARLAQSLIPNCQLYPFQRCRHAPHRERPERFNNLVSQFLGEK